MGENEEPSPDMGADFSVGIDSFLFLADSASESEEPPKPPVLETKPKAQAKSRGNTQSRLAAMTLEERAEYVGYTDGSRVAVANKP